MVSIDDSYVGSTEVVRGLLKEPIIGPIKSKIAKVRHLEIDITSYFLPRVVRFG